MKRKYIAMLVFIAVATGTGIQIVGGMQYEQKAKKNNQLCSHCCFDFPGLHDYLCGRKTEN